MPVAISTLPCKVEGLKNIYVCNCSIYFEFENREQLEKAERKVAVIYKTNSAFTLFSPSKKPIFAFSVYNKPIRALHDPIFSLILKAVNIMTTQTNMKKIPITKLEILH